MPLHHLEHFLIQTADLEGTRDWNVNTLGMRVGPNPDFKFPVVWLYIGDTDVLHLTVGGKNVSDNRIHKRMVNDQGNAAPGALVEVQVMEGAV